MTIVSISVQNFECIVKYSMREDGVKGSCHDASGSLYLIIVFYSTFCSEILISRKAVENQAQLSDKKGLLLLFKSTIQFLMLKFDVQTLWSKLSLLSRKFNDRTQEEIYRLTGSKESVLMQGGICMEIVEQWLAKTSILFH